MCIEFMSYSVILNQEPVGAIVLGRGLHQGDPLSLCLFILCSEGLASLIRLVVARGEIHAVDICRVVPTITNLLFADYCFPFLRVSPKEMEED